ncbi:MAG: monomethylamine:corrinoid methyltransferase [Saccharolobus sp.]|uniref:monomethylamine:corrinoid methyltransferase n=1 Tax=Saccharolobus sp. TaxID=2100761 RepID=UPI00316F7484
MPTPPYRIMEILDKAEEGPIMLERQFDRKLAIKAKELAKQYGITYDPDNVIPSDETLIKDLWKAGYELFLEIGVLVIDTSRVIKFTEEEIKESIKNHYETLVVGAGREAFEVYSRRIEDKRRPFIVFSPSLPYTEELFLAVEMAYAMEPLANGVGAPVMDEILGRPVKSKGPTDVGAAMAHAMKIREAVRRVGRPGLYLADVQSALSDTAQIAVSNPDWGVRYTDGRMVGTLAELKIDYGGLNRMINFHQNGYIVMALFGPMVGGYAGKVETTAIVAVAEHLMGHLVNQGHLHVHFPFDIREFNNTSRHLLWLTSVVHQSIALNSPFFTLANGITAAGPCTEMVFYEAAAHGIVATVSGAHLWEIFSARNRHKDYTTPLEARMAAEAGISVAHAGLRRSDVNEIAKSILKKYEDKIHSAPLGKKFQECYDIHTLKPTKEHLELYKRVKKDLTDMGIPFIY